MKRRFARIGLLTSLTLGLAACDNESRTRPPQTRVNVVHAAQSFGALNFRRVQRLERTLAYRQSSVFTWDSDTYTFNIDAVRPASDPEEVHSFTTTLTPGNDYVFVLGEDAGAISEIVVEVERGTVAAGDTGVIVVHTASTLGPVDLYLEPPGADLVAASPRGTVGFRGTLPAFGVPGGDYQISLTEVGNPANVLLGSTTFTLGAGATAVASLLDGADVGLAPFAVLLSGAGFEVVVVDSSLQAGIRALNAMTSGGALDVTIDSNFSPPLLPAVPVNVPSAYAFFDAGTRNLTVSPAGNPGVLEVDEEFTAENGVLGTWFIAGDPGALTATFSQDEGRIIPGEARLTIYNGVTSATAVNVYVVAAGTDLSTVAATASPPSLATVPGVALELGDLEITVRDIGTANVLAGPLAVTVTAEGSYGILLTDNTGGTVDITLLDAFN